MSTIFPTFPSSFLQNILSLKIKRETGSYIQKQRVLPNNCERKITQFTKKVTKKFAGSKKVPTFAPVIETQMVTTRENWCHSSVGRAKD